MSKLYARPISHDRLEAIAAGDASAAAVLSAYLRAEQMHAFRRLLWRRLAVLALAWVTFAAASSFISRIGLVAGLGVVAVGASGVWWLERQAARSLQTLLRRPRTRPGSPDSGLDARRAQSFKNVDHPDLVTDFVYSDAGPARLNR
jgi:hypothetical protein